MVLTRRVSGGARRCSFSAMAANVHSLGEVFLRSISAFGFLVASACYRLQQ